MHTRCRPIAIPSRASPYFFSNWGAMRFTIFNFILQQFSCASWGQQKKCFLSWASARARVDPRRARIGRDDPGRGGGHDDGRARRVDRARRERVDGAGRLALHPAAGERERGEDDEESPGRHAPMVPGRTGTALGEGERGMVRQRPNRSAEAPHTPVGSVPRAGGSVRSMPPKTMRGGPAYAR